MGFEVHLLMHGWLLCTVPCLFSSWCGGRVTRTWSHQVQYCPCSCNSVLEFLCAPYEKMETMDHKGTQ